MFECWYLLSGIVLSSTKNTCNWNSSGGWTFLFLQLLSLLHLGTMCSQSSLSDCWAPIILYGIWHGPTSRTVLLKEICTRGTRCNVEPFALFTCIWERAVCIIKIWYVKAVRRRWISAKSLYFVSEIHLNMMFKCIRFES